MGFKARYALFYLEICCMNATLISVKVKTSWPQADNVRDKKHGFNEINLFSFY